jgi:transposase InsO family protein
VRDQVIKFVIYWSERSELPTGKLLGWLGIHPSKFSSWRKRAGADNRAPHKQPRDGWLLEWEKQAIISFYAQHREEGYRRITYMLLDANIVAVSPSSVYRVLKQAGLMRAWVRKASKKGTGFQQPTAAHQHWHVDIAYINIHSTFFYLCSVLDGWSRYLVHWELKAQMTELDLEIILLRAREAFPNTSPRIICSSQYLI